MSRGYILSRLAEQDLYNIRHFIAQDSADAADRVLLRIRDEIIKLVAMPRMGHHREDIQLPNIRFWTVYSYLIVYRPDTAPMEIVRIIHGAQDIPNILGT